MGCWLYCSLCLFQRLIYRVLHIRHITVADLLGTLPLVLTCCAVVTGRCGSNWAVRKIVQVVMATVKWNKVDKTVLLFTCRYMYTGCPRRNVPDFGRVFLMLKYTDITQNTYVQSWTVTEIMARERRDLLAGPRTVPVSWQPYPCPSLSVVSYYGNSARARSKLFMYFLLGDKAVHVSAWHSCHV